MMVRPEADIVGSDFHNDQVTHQLYVDESKAKGYVLAAAVLVSSETRPARKALNALVLPGQRALHMKKEADPRRRLIADMVARLDVEISIYTAGTRYRTEREGRAACLEQLVKDAAGLDEAQLVLDLDESLRQWDNQQLIELVRRAGVRGRMTYRHSKAAQEPLLSIPDAVAWCWAKGGTWRERIQPVVTNRVDV